MRKLTFVTPLLFATLVGVNGCLSADDVVVSRISNAGYTATLSKRDHGALSRGSTLVSIRLDYVPDNDTHGLVVLGVDGNKPIEMKWLGDRNLALNCSSCKPQDVNFQAVKAGGLVITYGASLKVE